MSHQPQTTMHTYRQFRITISHNLPTARLDWHAAGLRKPENPRRHANATRRDRHITQRKKNTHLISYKFYCDLQTSTDLCRLSKSVFTPVIMSPPLRSSYLKAYSWFAFSREMLEVTKWLSLASLVYLCSDATVHKYMWIIWKYSIQIPGTVQTFVLYWQYNVCTVRLRKD